MSLEVITDETEGVIEGTRFEVKSLNFCRLTEQVALKPGTRLGSQIFWKEICGHFMHCMIGAN